MDPPPKKSSNKARQKKYREKKKEDPDYKKKQCERIKKIQREKKAKMTQIQLEELRGKKRQQKQKEREKKRQENLASIRSNEPQRSTISHIEPYKCVQTYSKAVLKCTRSLPVCPMKQKCIVQGVCKRLGIKLAEEMESSLCNDDVSEEENIVKDFYYRSDIVYTCPGMKDCMAVWKNGQKLTLQKHYLTMFLREAHYVFCQENPEIKISFSRFCSLRPDNVLLLKNTPAEQCKCKIHENFMLKLKSLGITYSHIFWQTVLCNDELSSECWKNSCDTCANLKLLDCVNNKTRTVYWKEWVKLANNKLKIKVNETSAGELYEKVLESYGDFVRHVYVKRIQNQEFTGDQKRENTRILQIDFAMSYSCEYQNEIQSALWARKSVTLFTAAVFFKNVCRTYVICSDCPKNKDTIFVFINHLYDLIISEDNDANITDVIWSDGPSSEFKNKFMVRLLFYLSKKYKKTFSWKYSATSHGKGVIDGVGGNVKHLVRQKSMSQGQVTPVQSAEDFAYLASSLVSNTKVIYISQTEIDAKVAAKNPWEKVDVVPGISKFHILYCDGEILKGKVHALDTQEKIFRPKHARFLV